MKKPSYLILRKATMDDCDLLYNWRNEKECRENSLNTDEIPYDTHCTWYARRLQDKDTLIYIAMMEEKCIGMVRLDIEITTAHINYSIDSNFRGQGMGRRLLEALETEPEVQQRVAKLCAVVKSTNMASQRCFERLGYLKVDDMECEMSKHNATESDGGNLMVYTKILKV